MDRSSLLELLEYDPHIGTLSWKKRDIKWFKNELGSKLWHGRCYNKPVGSVRNKKDRTDYSSILVSLPDGSQRYAHTLIWIMVYGFDPASIGLCVDHINGDALDNRLVNLRVVTSVENSRNQKQAINNSSGQTGVRFENRTGKWVAQIGINYKNLYLGSFDTLEEAVHARKEAEKEHGFHNNHGRV